MKLEVGMYVRTKKGLIAKYIEINNEYEIHIFDSKIQWFYEYYRNEIDFEDWEAFIKERVVKASHNIIDLIEVGDYVNGGLVVMKQDNYIMVGFAEYEEPQKLYNGDIKSILTREQFSAVEYKLD